MAGGTGSKNSGRNRPKGKPFVKGVSGNPAGRPRTGESVVDYLTAALSKEEWAQRLAAQCRKGSIRALELWGSWIFHSPLQRIETNNPDPEHGLLIVVRAPGGEDTAIGAEGKETNG